MSKKSINWDEHVLQSDEDFDRVDLIIDENTFAVDGDGVSWLIWFNEAGDFFATRPPHEDDDGRYIERGHVTYDFERGALPEPVVLITRQYVGPAALADPRASS